MNRQHNIGESAERNDARLHLVYTGVWSMAKVSLLVGLIMAAVTVLASALLWTILDQIGAFQQIDSLLSGPAGETTASSASSVAKVINFGTALVGSVAVGLVGALATMVGGMLIALLYDLSSKATGGLFIGFRHD
ncbi:DUF3566 domain-containing protein [Leifsonia aquatica]|uniref:DUF3566 domain-containing protein n=2 Tax=Leifsonia aquatica TaxID=144185 RepID=U2RXG9_LEIAQ|nr:DUF3566 domain-containing protein [Leifsonia aquatica]ERK73219.1 hypothetical protein N136_00411 [Leifsonia aquatica ATCC 14665]MBB2969285.1 hypothetical protein [Leifsonia aquatica]MBN9631739.1 DUF3566 domain-containing protein [Actinomycetota bacterium]